MSPTRILFIAESMLGDLLVMTPAICAVKRTFPQSHISLLIFQRRGYFRDAHATSFNETPLSGAAAVLRNNPNVDAVMEVDLQALRGLGAVSRVKAEVEIMLRLRRKKFDTVVVAPRDRFVVWAYACGARIRVGQRRQVYHQLLTHAPDIHKADAGALKYYCNLVEAIGAKVDSYQTEFVVPDYAEAFASEFLTRNGVVDAKPKIAIHPGSSGDDRKWPPERFSQLIDLLQSTSEATVILCGSPFDRDVLDAVRGNATTPALVADTSQDIALLAALLKRCTLFVGNDSGPRHLAAAVGTRTLALLARNTEQEWDVYDDKSRHCLLQGNETCPACPQGSCRKTIPAGEQYGAYCMRMIPVERVVAKVREMLHVRA